MPPRRTLPQPDPGALDSAGKEAFGKFRKQLQSMEDVDSSVIHSIAKLVASMDKNGQQLACLEFKAQLWQNRAQCKVGFLFVLDSLLRRIPEFEKFVTGDIVHIFLAVLSGDIGERMPQIRTILIKWQEKEYFPNRSIEKAIDYIQKKHLGDSSESLERQLEHLEVLESIEKEESKRKQEEKGASVHEDTDDFVIEDSDDEDEKKESGPSWQRVEQRWLRQIDYWRIACSAECSQAYTPGYVGMGIFIGGLQDAINVQMLQNRNITAVLNLSSNDNTSAYEGTKIIYKAVRAQDDGQCDITGDVLFEAAEWLDEHVTKQSRRVLIHCHEGVNRSGATIVGYMMMRHRIPLSTCCRMVCESRKRHVLKNDTFCLRLVRLARYLRLLR